MSASARFSNPALTVALDAPAPGAMAVPAGATPLPGVEVAGAGYHVFGDYPSASDVLGTIFDWGAAVWEPCSFLPDAALPTPLHAIRNEQYNYEAISGESVSEFQRNLTQQVEVSGSYGFFSGSVTQSYSKETYSRAENAFSNVVHRAILWDVFCDPDELRPLIRDRFRSLFDDERVPDAEIRSFLDRYGAFFVTGLHVGGAIRQTACTDKTKFREATDLKITAKMSLESKIGQLSTETESEHREALERFASSSQQTLLAIGGDATTAHAIEAGDYETWSKTIRSRPAFIGFRKRNALTRYSALARSDALRGRFAEIEDAYLAEKTRDHRLFPSYVSDITVIEGGNAHVKAPPGYKKIPYDLNKGSGGRYIYLCVHRETPDCGSRRIKAPITELAVTTHGTPPPGFTRIKTDLNKGSGGKYVYLCYKPGSTDPDSIDKAILDIAVIGGGSPSIPPPYGYEKVGFDLNKGSGGKYIYACVLRNRSEPGGPGRR
jgi:hypothetical protein